MRRIIWGALAGALATLPMSVFMLASQRAGLMGEQPPEKITRKLLRRAGARRPRPEAEDALATALHFGLGALAGALFALFGPLRLRIPDAILGALYGTGIWAVSYEGWVPGFGIMPPADRDRPDRQQSMLAAHWIYGVVLAELVSAQPHGGGRRSGAESSRTGSAELRSN